MGRELGPPVGNALKKGAIEGKGVGSTLGLVEGVPLGGLDGVTVGIKVDSAEGKVLSEVALDIAKLGPDVGA